MRLCFGGSFNPIHHGHLISGRAAAEALGASQVVLIPSAQPPHKPDCPELAEPYHRLAMCRLAAGMEPGLFEVEDVELGRTGPSYTIDTARELRRRGWPEVHWLIGADMLQILPKWHRAADLVREVRFHILARPGWRFDFATLPPEYRHLEQQVIDAPLLEISATEIRQRVAAGLSVQYLTPPAVAAYIHDHRLYR
jgi:nicotinate-nucleotide adenylyltransferase